MSLKLPLSSGSWNPCTYARPFVDAGGVVAGTVSVEEFLATIIEHCPDVAPTSVAAYVVGARHRFVPVAGGARHDLGDIEDHLIKRVFFLGVDENTALVGIQVHPGDTEGYADLRRWTADLNPTDMQLIATCAGLGAWHDNAEFCARCGGRARFDAGGWQRQCERCERIEYPRTDPSIIVAIFDDDDRILVAHNTMWRPGYASLVAGFMEMGEAPEQTVERETLEEVGLHVDQIEYVDSQAWPFPRSLMLGFRARVKAGTSPTPVPDGQEIEWARFYSREEYGAALRRGEVEGPGPISIARAMITDWYGEALPQPS